MKQLISLSAMPPWRYVRGWHWARVWHGNPLGIYSNWSTNS